MFLLSFLLSLKVFIPKLPISPQISSGLGQPDLPKPTSVKIVNSSKGHVHALFPLVPTGQHVVLNSSYFLDLALPLVSYYLWFLLYSIHISKGHKHSGLFCTKLQVLWFPTLFILLVKHVFSLISLILVCKALQRLCINAFLCYFYGILGPVSYTNFGHRGTLTSCVMPRARWMHIQMRGICHFNP